MGIAILILAIAATIATYIVMWSAGKCGVENNTFGACFMVVVLNGLRLLRDPIRRGKAKPTSRDQVATAASIVAPVQRHAYRRKIPRRAG